MREAVMAKVGEIFDKIPQDAGLVEEEVLLKVAMGIVEDLKVAATANSIEEYRDDLMTMMAEFEVYYSSVFHPKDSE